MADNDLEAAAQSLADAANKAVLGLVDSVNALLGIDSDPVTDAVVGLRADEIQGERQTGR